MVVCDYEFEEDASPDLIWEFCIMQVIWKSSCPVTRSKWVEELLETFDDMGWLTDERSGDVRIQKEKEEVDSYYAQIMLDKG